MALSKENSKDINDWLIEIDPGLFKYAQDFTRLDFTSSKTLKFFKPKDFDKFVCAPSSLHRRILLHNMEKLKTESPTLFTYDTPPEKDAHYQVKGLSLSVCQSVYLSVYLSVSPFDFEFFLRVKNIKGQFFVLIFALYLILFH